jgi:hypothetical protein
MRCYLVHDNLIIARPNASESADANTIVLHSIKDLDGRRFPITRLITLWNSLPGATPVKRFTDRKLAVQRLWQALEKLPLSSSRENSKQAQIVALIKRPQGAGLDELTTATGWQAHSVRGVLSGVIRKKLGLNVVSVQDGNGRIYRIAA